MKIDRLDAHDRYKDFISKDFQIGECCQNLIDQRPFGEHPFYIFAHPRTDEDGITKRLIWQPRLTRPKAQTNSMLFKAYPGKDIVKIIWMIPDRSLWKNYKKEQMIEENLIANSIHDFQFNREKLDTLEDDDLNDAQIHQIYCEISKQAKINKAKQERKIS